MRAAPGQGSTRKVTAAKFKELLLFPARQQHLAAGWVEVYAQTSFSAVYRSEGAMLLLLLPTLDS